MPIRYLRSFRRADASLDYEFPLGKYEWESFGGLRVPRQTLAGVDYAIDQIDGLAPKRMARETIRYTLNEDTLGQVDAEVDAMIQRLFLFARGQLVARSHTNVDTWAWARLADAPRLRVTQRVGLSGLIPVTLHFDRYSDWFQAVETTDTLVVTSGQSSPQTLTVNNPGALPASIMVIRIRSDGGNQGFRDVRISNTTVPDSIPGAIGYSFETGRISTSVNDEVRLDTGRGTVGYSSDDGVNYIDDLGEVEAPADHPLTAFVLWPGDNEIEVSFTTPGRFRVAFAFFAPERW